MWGEVWSVKSKTDVGLPDVISFTVWVQAVGITVYFKLVCTLYS